MFKKIFYDFFLINLKDYPNIGGDLYINVLLLCVALGICATAIVVTLYRSSLQRLIKQLTRLGAESEESARTLREMGLEKSIVLRMALSREGRLTRLVGRVGEVKYTYEEYLALSKQKGFRHEKIDFTTAEFYIREEHTAEAKNIIDNYGASMLRAVLYSVGVIAVYVCVMFFMPEILSLIDAALGA